MFVPWLTVRPRPATKISSSSWVMPLMTGTRANCPRASAVPIGWVSTEPSTTPGISTPNLADQVADRHAAQARRALVRAADGGGERLARRLGRGQRLLVQRERAALHDGPLEQPASAGRDQLGQHRQAAGRLARDGHVARVAAEPGDVALDPAQRRLLVHQPVVAGRAARPGGQRRVREEAERAEPVVDRDDHRAVRRELGAVVVAGAVLLEAAAVDPHQDRAPAKAATRRGRVDVEVQAVLAERAGRRERARRLRAARPERRRVPDSGPARGRLRWPPPQVPGRRRRVRQPQERVHPRGAGAADETVINVHDRVAPA